VHDGETGLLVPPACPEIAARRVVELGGDPALRERLSVRARALLGAEFDLERMVRALERDYLELLAHAPPAQARTLPSWDR
jgi:glycosyltransferase involved in cell wall biosynthesis